MIAVHVPSPLGAIAREVKKIAIMEDSLHS
jgi:hypothetical protein